MTAVPSKMECFPMRAHYPHYHFWKCWVPIWIFQSQMCFLKCFPLLICHQYVFLCFWHTMLGEICFFLWHMFWGYVGVFPNRERWYRRVGIPQVHLPWYVAHAQPLPLACYGACNNVGKIFQTHGSGSYYIPSEAEFQGEEESVTHFT